MSLAAPAGLALLLLAIPIVVLHILRPRRDALPVSSTWLWTEMSRPVTAASPWQRLRPSVLLLLQLLAVALLALAVARPVQATEAPLSPHTVFVIDASGSMAARDGSPERLDRAKSEAERLRSELPDGGVASIVVADNDPHVALSSSGDRRAFSDALRTIRAIAAPADAATAFSLAASLETPGLPLGVVLLSDGGLDDAGRRALLPGTKFVPIGERSSNRAITRLIVEPDGAGLRAIVVLRNTGGPDATETVRVDVDGRTEASFEIDVPRGETVERAVALPDGERVEAFLDADDLLLADNHAFAVAARRPPVRVLHVGPDNPFLDRLWAALPGVSVERSATTRPASGYDLAVYDRVAVPSILDAPALVIAPPTGMAEVRVSGAVEGPAIAFVDVEDALLAGIDLADVTIASAQRVEAPRDQTLVAAEGAPLVVRGVRDGRSFVYVAFALEDSDLPLQVAFPVLGDRLVSELAGAAIPAGDLRVGQPLSVGADATVTFPGGARETPAGAAAVTTTRAGFHSITQPGRVDRLVAVNVDPVESVVGPDRSLPIPEPQDGDRRVPTHGERSLLRYVVGALFAVLLAELLLSRRQIGVPVRQWRAGLAVRVVIVAALLGALLEVTLPRRGSGVATVFLIDASDSMGSGGRSEAVDWVREALETQPANARAGVAFFGGNARLELTLQRDAQLIQPATTVDATRTNLAGALRLAAAVLPADARRRIVVVSDGRVTEGDAATEATRLRREGVRVDVHAVARTTGRDAAVARLDAPGRAAQGETVTLQATVVASEATSARLTLDLDGTILDDRLVELAAGENVVTFDHAVAAPGVNRYRVTAEVGGDVIRENNASFAAIEIDGPPRVLVAEGAPGEARALVAALEAAAIGVEVVDAASLPDVDRLADYRSTILVDVDARMLSAAQTEALTRATRDLGRGLVTVGGTRAYALGGYRDSPLEALLPVISDITDPKRRSSVAEVLALDVSGSMGACHCADGGANGMVTGGNRANGGINKTDIAKAGAARAVAALSSSDQVGVLAFSDDQKMVLPMQTAPAAEEVRERLAGVRPNGQTDVNAGLRRAASELRATKAKLKHVILFTDGFTPPGNLEALEAQAGEVKAEGITVSVVATGEGAAVELARVAEAGGGRFYTGRDLNEIPEILVQEAVLASRNFVNEGEFFPTIVGSAAAVQGLEATPPLLGYVATTSKPTASTSLRIGEDEDPLLTSWNVGLGRSTSWTSDASDRWSAHWATWEGYVDFWSTVVRETFPASVAGMALRTEIEGDRLRLTLESENPIAEGSDVTARVTTPAGATSTVTLERTSATTFSVDVPASSAGTYASGVTVEGDTTATLTALASQSYGAEYRPGATDSPALRDVSSRSGGRGEIGAAQAFDVTNLTAGRARVALAGWLLLLAAVLWPVDVALRRLTLRPAAARAVLRRVPRLRLPAHPGRPTTTPRPTAPESSTPTPTPTPEPATAPPSLARLLERKRRGEDGGGGQPDER